MPALLSGGGLVLAQIFENVIGQVPKIENKWIDEDPDYNLIFVSETPVIMLTCYWAPNVVDFTLF